MMAQSWLNAVLATSETSQTAVTADFLSQQLLSCSLHCMTKTKAVTDNFQVSIYFSSYFS